MQAKYSQMDKNDSIAITDQPFKDLLPSIEEIMTFQKKTFETSLVALGASDTRNILQHCGIPGMVSIVSMNRLVGKRGRLWIP